MDYQITLDSPFKAGGPPIKWSKFGFVPHITGKFHIFKSSQELPAQTNQYAFQHRHSRKLTLGISFDRF